MAQRRGGLGRGLESLIPSGGDGASSYAVIPLDQISPNPQQPRVMFDEDSLASLAESISEIGVLQPIAVTRTDDGYQLIAGERRWRAARRAGLTEIPAVIRGVDDTASLVEALVENVQRADLSPLEEAAAYKQLLEDFSLTHEEVGSRVGRSRSAITNAIRLLQLSAGIQSLLESGALSAGAARALVGLEDRAYAEHIARRAVDEGWSVRQIEEAVRARGDQTPSAAPSPQVREIRPVEIIELEQRLTEQLGTNVGIKYRNRKGTVTIKFSSLDDLERIYRRFF